MLVTCRIRKSDKGVEFKDLSEQNLERRLRMRWVGEGVLRATQRKRRSICAARRSQDTKEESSSGGRETSDAPSNSTLDPQCFRYFQTRISPVSVYEHNSSDVEHMCGGSEVIPTRHEDHRCSPCHA